MGFEDLRKELSEYYFADDGERSRYFAEKCFEILERRVTPSMSVAEQKMLQYDVIVENFEPVVFSTVPYFFETGVLTALSDGARGAKGYRFTQANGWVYRRNEHFFIDQDKELYERVSAQKKEKLYLICGPYNDVSQHFNFNNRPIYGNKNAGI